MWSMIFLIVLLSFYDIILRSYLTNNRSPTGQEGANETNRDQRMIIGNNTRRQLSERNSRGGRSSKSNDTKRPSSSLTFFDDNDSDNSSNPSARNSLSIGGIPVVESPKTIVLRSSNNRRNSNTSRDLSSTNGNAEAEQRSSNEHRNNNRILTRSSTRDLFNMWAEQSTLPKSLSQNPTASAKHVIPNFESGDGNALNNASCQTVLTGLTRDDGLLGAVGGGNRQSAVQQLPKVRTIFTCREDLDTGPGAVNPSEPMLDNVPRPSGLFRETQPVPYASSGEETSSSRNKKKVTFSDRVFIRSISPAPSITSCNDPSNNEDR